MGPLSESAAAGVPQVVGLIYGSIIPWPNGDIEGFIGFFVFMGALNLYVAYNFSTDNWVNFKLFGGMGLMLLFVLAQAAVLSRFVDEKDERRSENP